MSYYEQMADLAKQISSGVNAIQELEKAREKWSTPGHVTFWTGRHTDVTRKDGSTHPRLINFRREAIAALDGMLIDKKSEVEGLRYRMAELGKKGGAA